MTPGRAMTSVEPNSLVRGAGVALWRQIEQAVEAEIAERRLAAGERLPTEHALADRFGVNRHTVRQALASLEERGLVRVEQGRGTFVHDDPVDYAVRKRTRFSETIRRQNREPNSRLVRAESRPAEAAIARPLGLRKGDTVILLETVGEADGRPISIASHYFPAARVPDLIAAYRAEQSITRALARCGVPDYTRKSTRVTARLPTAEDARALRLPRSRPVLVAENLNIDQEGRPIEISIARLAAERVQLVFEP
ncbi:MAG: phosphonate metabolism transcriptional regulator PhnF [Acidobacteria bacterium]|nr:phosphonate metabolism transcriptional regulator PhnF [Acidobacteriota bacterium]